MHPRFSPRPPPLQCSTALHAWPHGAIPIVGRVLLILPLLLSFCMPRTHALLGRLDMPKLYRPCRCKQRAHRGIFITTKLAPSYCSAKVPRAIRFKGRGSAAHGAAQAAVRARNQFVSGHRREVQIFSVSMFFYLLVFRGPILGLKSGGGRDHVLKLCFTLSCFLSRFTTRTTFQGASTHELLAIFEGRALTSATSLQLWICRGSWRGGGGGTWSVLRKVVVARCKMTDLFPCTARRSDPSSSVPCSGSSKRQRYV